MRGALLIAVLLATLIVGVLVIKNYYTGSETEADKTQIVKKAEKSADAAEDAMQELNQRIKDTME